MFLDIDRMPFKQWLSKWTEVLVLDRDYSHQLLKQMKKEVKTQALEQIYCFTPYRMQAEEISEHIATNGERGIDKDSFMTEFSPLFRASLLKDNKLDSERINQEYLRDYLGRNMIINVMLSMNPDLH